MHEAETLIRENLRTRSPKLDLTNCRLTGKEPCLQLLTACTQHGLTALKLGGKKNFLPIPQNTQLAYSTQKQPR